MKTIEEKCALCKWFFDDVDWYVLFVKTNEELSVVERLRKELDSGRYHVFVPTKDYAFRVKYKVTTRRKNWLSGYVFIATQVAPSEIVERLKSIISYSRHIYKLLGNNTNPSNAMLSTRDKTLMTTILDENFNIPAFNAYMIGDKVILIDDNLRSLGGKVIKVNKQRHTVIFELPILGKLVSCEVRFECINALSI